MTGFDGQESEYDLEAPDSVAIRFGMSFVESHRAEARAVVSMPMERFRNPVTGAPSVGPLAILVDVAAGLVNHHRRGHDEWTVSSELSMELTLDELDELDGPVVASARAGGARGATSVGGCTLSYEGTTIGAGTVRSFFIPAGRVINRRRYDTLRRLAGASLSELMAVDVRGGGAGAVLSQRADPNLNNDMGIVHGGVAAAGLELAAAAAIGVSGPDDSLRTGSLRVNFLRPFFTGADSRYIGTPLRVGRGTAVGEAEAVGADGRVAAIARVTAYRSEAAELTSSSVLGRPRPVP